MELNYIFFITFIMTFLVIFKMLLGMNIDKIFKQGRIIEIRIFYFITCFILSYLTASALTSLIDVMLKILKIN